jgi:PDZ domain-containing protein
VTHVRYAFNAYWFVALSCAAIAFFIIIQYPIRFISEICRLHSGGKRAIERMRNLKRGEPLEPQPAVSPDLPLQVSAEVQPILEHAEPPEPEPAVSPDLPLQVSAEVQPILEHAEPPEPEPAASPDLPLQVSAEVQPILEHAEPPEPEPAASPDLPLQVSAEVQPILEHAEPPEPQPAVSPDLPLQVSVEVQPILEHAEPPEPQPAVSGTVYTAQKDYGPAIANYSEAIKVDPKFAIAYENDVATAKEIQARNSEKHVRPGRLADASDKKEAALTPKEESTPEDKSAAKKVRAFKGSIGVSIRRVTDRAAHTLNVKPARGALVVGVDENGPAKAAGIEPDDVIVKVDGMDVKECRDLPRIVADTPAGKDVAVTIIREGKELTKTVKVGWLEDADNAPQKMAPGMPIVEIQQQPVSSAPLFLVPPAPPRFGKRCIDRFSKVNH